MLLRYILLLSFISFLFLTSCSTSQSTTSEEEFAGSENIDVVDKSVVVNEKLEEARQFYLEALKNQRLGFNSEAVSAFEEALLIINSLSYYPDIDENEAYYELENSIVEDYQKFIGELDELPEGSSIYALEEWMSENLPEMIMEDETLDDVDITKEVIVVGDFPLEVNRYVENYIEYFTGRGRKHMEVWLSRSGKYFPMMGKIFGEEEVPQQLIFLSMMESGLNPKARSWARAVGIWQFVRGTARMYDLEVNFYVDDRKDPEKATRAAARHLRDLYVSLGDWYLAIASYNSGEARVRRAMRRTNSENFWKIRGLLPKETRNYVPQYIAVTLIASNPSKYGFNNVVFEKPIETVNHNIDEAYDLSVLAKCAGVSLEIMHELNPSLIQHCTPPEAVNGFDLKLPAKSYESFLENIKNVPEEAKLQYVLHKVKTGETLSGIANKYDVKLNHLAKVNNISTRSKIYPGVNLKIPISDVTESDFDLNTDVMIALEEEMNGKDSTASYFLVVNENNNEEDYLEKYQARMNDSTAIIIPDSSISVTYKVKRGDNLVDIADLFETRVSDLRNWNNLPYTANIFVGQALNIFVPEKKKDYYIKIDELSKAQKLGLIYANTEGQWIDHRIRWGESLSTIAYKYGVKISQIKEWNNIRSNNIFKGQRLKIYVGDYSNYISNSEVKDSPKSGEYSKYIIRAGDTLSEIAEKYGVSSSQLRRWNKLSSNRIVAGKTLKIYGKSKSVEEEKVAAKIEDEAVDKGDYYEYKIKRGDTLGHISLKFLIPTSKLRQWNNMSNNKIVAGDIIKIYKDKNKAIASSTNSMQGNSVTPDSGNSDKITHIITRGETLSHVATNYNLKIADIKKWNKLTSNRVFIGQELLLYTSAKNDSSTKTSETVTVEKKDEIEIPEGGLKYTVKEGESLWLIAKKFNCRVADILAWNDLKDDKIKPGLELIILKREN